MPITATELQPSPDTSRPLREAQTIARRLPVNFDERDRDLFAHELKKTIPETQLRQLRGVRISPEGLLFKRGRILTESFAFPFLRDEWKSRSVLKFLVRNYLLRKTRNFENPAVWIVDEWSTGYFHWLTDVLSKLFLIKDHVKSRVLLLPQQYERFDFVRASLKAFDVNEIKFIGPDEVLRCEDLVLPTPVAPSGHFREDIIQGVRQHLTRHYGASAAQPGDRIYVSRERAQKRKVLNEAEIIDVLREYRFEIIHAEGLSLAEQVRMFSQARYLVSNHGAGLTNMLFMTPGGTVLELRHATDKVSNCYYTLASALELNYLYQSCEPANPDEPPHTADLKVDTSELRANLELMLAS